MEIKNFKTGVLLKTEFLSGYVTTNGYVVTDESYDGGIIIDAPGRFDDISAYLESLGKKPAALLLTHGHWDHIAAVLDFRRAGAATYMREEDAKMLREEWSMAREMDRPVMSGSFPDYFVKDGETLKFGDMKFTVIHTPGHSKGSCCYDLDSKYLFSGDTLFRDSYGRTDLHGGSAATIADSIKNKLFALSGDREVFPGHEITTTLSYERKYNPILWDSDV